jgi:hypothetical protein
MAFCWTVCSWTVRPSEQELGEGWLG